MNRKWPRLGVVALAIGALSIAAASVSAQEMVDPNMGNPPVMGGPGTGGLGRGVDIFAIVAEQLGIDQSELMADLQSGKTIAELAEELGVSTDTIVAALVAAEQNNLDSLVANGTLTQDEADARLEQFTTNAASLLDGTLPANGGGFGPRNGFDGGVDFMAIVAEQLGIDQSELMADLQSGKTIAELAEELVVSTDTIVAAIIAAEQEKLDSAVADGTLTQEEADARLEQITANAQSLVDGTLPAGGFGPGSNNPGMPANGNGFGQQGDNSGAPSGGFGQPGNNPPGGAGPQGGGQQPPGGQMPPGNPPNA